MPFDGDTYESTHDRERLSTALERVWCLMRDGQWRTLSQISKACNCSEASASARLRDFRKLKFKLKYPVAGVERQRVEKGLYEYRLIVEQRQQQLF